MMKDLMQKFLKLKQLGLHSFADNMSKVSACLLVEKLQHFVGCARDVWCFGEVDIRPC